MNEEFDRLIRVTRLRDELKPVQIYMGDPPEPIAPDWIGIVHRRWKHERRSEPLESFGLSFRRDDGSEITWEQFGTLGIAIDQAHAIVGITPDEWRVIGMDMTDDGWPWKEIEKRLSSKRVEARGDPRRATWTSP
jgi:hypothetical protein